PLTIALPLVDSMVSLSSPTLPLEQQGHDVEHKPEYQEINVVGEKSMLLQNEKVRKDSEKMKKQSREKKVRWAPAPTCEPNVNRTPKSTVSKSCAPAPSVSHVPALQSLNNEGENKLPDDKELKGTESPPVREDVSVGVAQLDLLGGHIVSTEKNSDADSLHQVDVGGTSARSVLSPSPKHVHLDQRKTLSLLCNLRPAKIGGINLDFALCTLPTKHYLKHVAESLLPFLKHGRFPAGLKQKREDVT
uniref:Uncharacterized protein n=1 Tax=Cynoglossus semilaevis TaxID=244447 RepID=A0A3P8UMH7_CYNSE